VTARHKIAYVSRLIYPDPQANALQTIQMAAAFANQNCDAHLFVHDMAETEDQIRQNYAVNYSPLRIWSLHAGHWPSFIYDRSETRFLAYNSAVSAILGFHPEWLFASEQRKVLFVRSRLEFFYWGLLKSYLWWLRDWILAYEAHDLELDTSGDTEKRRTRTQNAFANYDLVISVTHSLAEDIQGLTSGAVRCEVVPLCTGLQRLPSLRGVQFSSDHVLLGYIGTVDINHGVGDLFEALKLLPDRYRLRLVGRVRPDIRAHLEQWMIDPAVSGRAEILPPVHYSELAEQIDACDILLSPAGDSMHSRRYRSPLKLFDYMARGKPVIAAGVPSNKELLQDGRNARLYRPGDPEDLAACIMSLADQPGQAEAIARKAWEQSASYTYDARASRILELVDETWERRKSQEVRELH